MEGAVACPHSYLPFETSWWWLCGSGSVESAGEGCALLQGGMICLSRRVPSQAPALCHDFPVSYT